MKKYETYGLIAFLIALVYKIRDWGYQACKIKQRKKNDKIKKKIKKGVSNLSTRERNRLRKRYNK